MWFKKDKEKPDLNRLPTLEAAVSNLRRRLRETKRELEELKSDQRKFERELLLKLGRLEGVLGIGLGGGAEESTTTTTRPGIDFERRRQEEEAERIALEQLGTGGSAQAVSDAVISKEEEE